MEDACATEQGASNRLKHIQFFRSLKVFSAKSKLTKEFDTLNKAVHLVSTGFKVPYEQP